MRKTESLHGEDVYYKVYTPIVKKFMDENNLPDDSYLPEFFVTAQTLDYKERIDMQAIFQEHIDASISSTVNVPNNFTVEDKWIISKLNSLIPDIKQNMDNYDLGVALDKIYSFIWNEFCDWYIEIVKTRLYDKENKTKTVAQYVLNKVLGESLKLLHPFMPFETEKIYSELYNVDESIMIANYPTYSKELEFKSEEEAIEEFKEVITGIRNVRAKMNVHPSKKAKLIFVTTKYSEVIKESSEFLKKLGFADNIEIKENKDNITQNAVNIITSNLELFIPFEDLVDIQEEIARLEKEKEKVLIEKEKTDKMLNNPGFIEKAPTAKVEEEKEKQVKFNEMIKTIEERINKLK